MKKQFLIMRSCWKKKLPDTLFGAAFAYYQSGKLQRAVHYLNELIEIDPDYLFGLYVGWSSDAIGGKR